VTVERGELRACRKRLDEFRRMEEGANVLPVVLLRGRGRCKAYRVLIERARDGAKVAMRANFRFGGDEKKTEPTASMRRACLDGEMEKVTL